jgi:hypothetical protein
MRTPRLIFHPIALAVASLCLGSINAYAQNAIQLDQMLSKDQQQNLGVTSMRLEQRELLRQIMIGMFRQGYEVGKKEGSLTANRLSPNAVVPLTSQVVESQVDGDFNGWEGETIVKLMNGQIWRQTEYHYEYHYAFMPNALVCRAGGGYKMKIEGVDTVGVERLR